MAKNFRQEQILKLIAGRPLHSQTELAAALRRAGVAATQVTLSRDLKELGVVKTGAGYAVLTGTSAAATGAPAAGAPTELGHILREFGRDLRPAQNLLVVKTAAGAAPTVAAALDRANLREVAGSLAGDDTVLLVFANPRLRLNVEQRLRQLLG
ncbi:MAG TPA: ArgR family transcriptional regulator [Terriglobales bacterium]